MQRKKKKNSNPRKTVMECYEVAGQLDATLFEYFTTDCIPGNIGYHGYMTIIIKYLNEVVACGYEHRFETPELALEYLEKFYADTRAYLVGRATVPGYKPGETMYDYDDQTSFLTHTMKRFIAGKARGLGGPWERIQNHLRPD